MFLILSLDGSDAYSLKECPKIVAEFHTTEQLQSILPAIIFSEDKVEGMKKNLDRLQLQEGICKLLWLPNSLHF